MFRDPSSSSVLGSDPCLPHRSEGEWDFYWCDVSWLRENFDHTYMDEHVRISHFRNHYEVSLRACEVRMVLGHWAMCWSPLDCSRHCEGLRVEAGTKSWQEGQQDGTAEKGFCVQA